MMKPFQFENFNVKPVFLNREINFEITDSSGYVGRLVPVLNGFEFSKLDKAIANAALKNLAARLSDYILSHNE